MNGKKNLPALAWTPRVPRCFHPHWEASVGYAPRIYCISQRILHLSVLRRYLASVLSVWELDCYFGATPSDTRGSIGRHSAIARSFGDTECLQWKVFLKGEQVHNAVELYLKLAEDFVQRWVANGF